MDIEYQLSNKRVERNVLVAELDEEKLWDCERYHRLNRQIAKLREKCERSESVSSPVRDRE